VPQLEVGVPIHKALDRMYYRSYIQEQH